MFCVTSRMFLLTILTVVLCGCEKKVEVVATAGGSIEEVLRVRKGDLVKATFTVHPDDGYVIDVVEGCKGTLDGEHYVTGWSEADCAVKASFLPLMNLGFDVKRLDISWPEVSGTDYYRLYEKVGDGGDLKQIGADLKQNSISIDTALHLNESRESYYRLESCDKNGCRPSYGARIYDGGVKVTGYIKASNAEPGDYFGRLVALSGDGNTLVVAAPGESSGAIGIDGEQADNSHKRAGAVYVYYRDGGVWRQQGYLKPSEWIRYAFGTAVAISGDGNVLAVGSGQGVYVYTREHGQWRESEQIVGEFLDSLALSDSGEVLAVQAGHRRRRHRPVCYTAKYECIKPPQIVERKVEKCYSRRKCDEVADKSPFYMSDSYGGVYILTRSQNKWRHQAYLRATNPDEYMDDFGVAMALSADGRVVAIGSPDDDSRATGINGNEYDETATEAGAVYIYTRSGNDWRRDSYIKASNADARDRFGTSVALSGDGRTLAVGAPHEKSSATGIDGDQSDNSAYDDGSVYLFAKKDDNWRQVSYVKSVNEKYNMERVNNKRFGSSVALSGDGSTLIAGAPYDAGSTTGVNGVQKDRVRRVSGGVFVYTLEDETWRHKSYVKAPNAQAGDKFGVAVALSRDGGTLAVGADGEGSSAGGICVTANRRCADAQALNVEKSRTRDVGAVYLY